MVVDIEYLATDNIGYNLKCVSRNCTRSNTAAFGICCAG